MFTPTHSNLGRFWLLLVLMLGVGAARADDRTFDLGGGPAVLSDVSAQVGLRFTSLRFSPNDNGWLVDIVLTNKSLVVIPTPLVLWVESYSGTTGPIGPDGFEGSNPPHAFYDYTAQAPDALLWPGDKTKTRTLLLGYNSGAPTIVGRVYAKISALPPGLTMVRTLNEVGQPLPGVAVTENSPLGNSVTTSDLAFGIVTVGRTNGPHTWRFDLPDYLPVWRRASLLPGEVSLTPSPRLTKRATGVSVPMAGGNVPSSSINLTVPAGAFAQNTTINLTPLTAQTLPAVLPLGWSPLQAFWVETPTEPLVPLNAVATLWGPLYGSESAALVWWNSNSVAWEVVQTLTGPATAPTVNLPKRGAFAIVVPDNGAWSPPAAVVGQSLMGASLPVPAYDGLTATGSVSPAVSVASRIPERLTGQAGILVTSGTGALPSGLPLFSKFRNDHALRDGSQHRTPSYENFVVGYQRPGDLLSNTLQVSFPMRPLLLFDSDALAQATVESDLLPPGDYGLRVLGRSGGPASFGGISLQAAAGVFSRREALYLRPLATDDLSLLSHSNATAVAGFDLGITGIAAGSNLVLQVSGITSNRLFVLARVIFKEGLFGLEPVQRLASNGAGILSSLEPTSGEHLPGITGAGQYALMRVNSAQGLITGIAHNAAGQAIAGLPVRIDGQPWLTLSGVGGTFRLVAPAGDALVTVTDPATGDTGQTTVNIPAPGVPVNANPNVVASGPRVVSVTPTNGATGVARVTPVIVQFSEPIAPATWSTNGVQLFGTNNQLIAATLTLNLQHTIATLLPVAQLAANTLHTIRVSSNLTDTTGLKLEGATQFTFTTENDALNRLVAQLTSYEPVNGMAAIVGSPGTADPESPVILVNETSGQTATILSKPDGSFSNSIPADVDDWLGAVLVNQNGTRNEIPVGRQVFRDGSVGLFQGGGILEAQSDGGPVQVIVEPGAIENKVKFKLENLSISSLLQEVGNTLPVGGKLLAGFRFSAKEGTLADDARAKVHYPITPERMDLPPGTDPEQAGFVLAIPRQVGGVLVYDVIDKVTYKDGELQTASPPFQGILGSLLNFGAYVILHVSGDKPAVILGKVNSVTTDSSGTSTTKPVPGAVVFAIRAGEPLGEAGTLFPGAIVATAGETGSFVLSLPVEDVGTSFSLLATSPLFPNAYGYGHAVFRREDVYRINTTEVVFSQSATATSLSDDHVLPRLTVGHSPEAPGVGATAHISILATDNRGIDHIDFNLKEVAAIDSSITPTLADVIVSAPVATSTTAQTARSSYDVTANQPLKATFTVLATDTAGNQTPPTDYSITFGGPDSVLLNPTPDSSDTNAPYVIASEPSQGADDWRLGKAIELKFSEPIDAGFLSSPSSAFQLTPNAGTPVVTLSSDQQTVTIAYYNLKQDTAYSLTVSSAVIRDINGKFLDQYPYNSTPKESLILTFKTKKLTEVTMPGVGQGAGVVSLGKYLFALDQQSDPNKQGLVVVGFSTPDTPQEVARFSFEFPRAILAIPQYSFKRDYDGEVETKDLIVLAGGYVGGDGQQIAVLDVSDPTHPKQIAGTFATQSRTAAITKLSWSAPILGLLEMDSVTGSSVSLVNLQLFIHSVNMTSAQRALEPLDGNPGLDLNGDGDFVDTGDELPRVRQLKPTSGFLNGGLVATHTLRGLTTQRIADFTLDLNGSFLGVVAEKGFYLGSDGAPTAIEAPAEYLTLRSGDEEPDPTLAAMEIEGIPRSVGLLTGVGLEISGQFTVANLALVSIRNTDGKPNRLVVVDVTNPSGPNKLSEIEMPSGIGAPRTAVMRNDGLVMLATVSDLLLLDPSKLALPQPSDGSPHPALTGVINEQGGGYPSFVGDSSDLYAIAFGGQNKILVSSQFANITAHRPGTMASPGDVIPEASEDDPLNLILMVNEDNDDGILPPGDNPYNRLPNTYADDQDDQIGPNDNDIVTLTLSQLPSFLVAPKLEGGTITLEVSGGELNLFDAYGGNAIKATSIADTIPPTSAYFSGLDTNDVKLFMEALSPSEDVTVRYRINDSSGALVGSDEVHLAQARVKITDVWSDQLPGFQDNRLSLTTPDSTGSIPHNFILMANRADFKTHVKARVEISPDTDAIRSRIRVGLLPLQNATYGLLTPIGTSELQSDQSLTIAAYDSRVIDDLNLKYFFDYLVVAGFDSNADGELNSEETGDIFGTSYLAGNDIIFTMRDDAFDLADEHLKVVNQDVYNSRVLFLKSGVFFSGIALPSDSIARENLTIFADGDAASPNLASLSGSYQIGINQLDENVGANFDATSTARIPNYVYDQSTLISDRVLLSPVVREAVRLQLSIATTRLAVAAEIAAHPGEDTVTLNTTLNTSVQFARSGLLDDDARDLYYGIGGASLNVEILFTATRNPTNTSQFLTTFALVRGEVVDLYDWKWLYDLDTKPAAVQAGYGTLGAGGPAFRYEIPIQGQISDLNLTYTYPYP